MKKYLKILSFIILGIFSFVAGFFYLFIYPQVSSKASDATTISQVKIISTAIKDNGIKNFNSDIEFNKKYSSSISMGNYCYSLEGVEDKEYFFGIKLKNKGNINQYNGYFMKSNIEISNKKREEIIVKINKKCNY